MAWIKMWLPGLALGSLFLVLSGLVHIDYVDCSTINPSWSAYASDYVEARGFPFGWIITGSETCVISMHWWQRFLAGRFSMYYVVVFLPVLGIGSLISWRQRKLKDI